MPSKISKYNPGQIISLKLLNFMCHDLFEINFEPGVNFIYGQNGSGKSAILTALCTVLGAPTSFTKRGSNDELVKDGCDHFEISVEINNLFGSEEERCHLVKSETFFIKRSVRRGGASSYFISENGITFKKLARTDLNEILVFLNVQPTNPCVIMNQDSAREFLNSKTDRERYKMFMKATLLERIDKTIIDAKSSLAELETELKSVSKELKLNRQIAKNDEEEYKNAEKFLNKDRCLHELDVKIELAKMIEKEDEKEELMNLIKDTNKKISKKLEIKHKIEEEIVRMKGEQNELELKENDIKESVDKKKTNITRFENRFTLLDKNVRSGKESIKKLNMQFEENEAFLKAEEGKKQRFLKSINFEQTERYNNIVTKIDNDKEELSLAVKTLESKKELCKQKKANLDKIEKVLEDEKNFASVDEKKLKRLTDHLTYFRRNRDSKILNFGDRAIDILNEINLHVDKFSVKPIGPIGFFLDISDSVWTKAIENCVGFQMLFGYLVSTYEDFVLLDKILSRTKHFVAQREIPKPNIYVQKMNKTSYNVFDSKDTFAQLSDSSIVRRLKRVTDVLKVSGKGLLDRDRVTWVENTLVDQCGVEKSFLAINYDQAFRFLVALRNANVEEKKLVSCVYCKNGDRVMDRNGRSVANFVYYSSFRGFLNIDVEKEMKILENEIGVYNNSLKQRNNVIEDKEKESKSLIVEIESLEKEIENIAKERDRKENELNELEVDKRETLYNIEDEERLISFEKTIEKYLSTKRAIEKTIEEKQREVGSRIEEMQTIKGNVAEIEEEEEAITKEDKMQLKKLRELRKRLRMLEKRYEDIEHKMVRMKREEIVYRNKSRELEGELELLLESIISLYLNIEKMIGGQNSSSERNGSVEEDNKFEKLISENNDNSNNSNIEIGIDVNVNEGLNGNERIDLRKNKALRELNTLKDNIRKEGVTLKELKAEKLCMHSMFSSEKKPTLKELEDIRKKFLASKGKFESLKTKKEVVGNQALKIKKALNSRERDKTLFKKNLSEKVSSLFAELLHKQGHEGKIIFYHEYKELKIEVNLYSYKQKENLNNNKLSNFSGGEKSFSTLAFIIAVGEFIESPFRAIDEFDIFMDSVNRMISMKMVVEACKRNPEKQYIFITPQDISILEEEENVKIFKMKPPRID